MSAKSEHLGMIQTVIARLAGNSFAIKGWTVAIVSAILGAALSQSKPAVILVALIPVPTFWGLDAYYLHQERLLRKLYEIVRTKDEDAIDFLMNSRGLQDGRQDGWRGWIGCAFSRTLLPFYTVPVVVTALVFVYMTWCS